MILEHAILLHEYSTNMLNLHFEHWSMFDSWTCHIASWIFNKDVQPPLWMLINVWFLNLTYCFMNIRQRFSASTLNVDWHLIFEPLVQTSKIEVHHSRLYANHIRLLWGLKFGTWALRKLKAHKLQPTSVRVQDNRGRMYVQCTQWLQAHNVLTNNYLWFGLFIINWRLYGRVAFIF